MTPLEFEPGTKYQYSNAGISTAARSLEVVTGGPTKGPSTSDCSVRWG